MSFNLMRTFVLLTYMLASVLSALPVMRPTQQSTTEHALMMAMAGHVAAMAAMDDRQSDDVQMLLCEQHCRIATATLPLAQPPAPRQMYVTHIPPGPAPVAVSLILPPPGPPPKAALI